MNTEVSEKDIFEFLCKNGNIDIAHIQTEIMEQRNRKYLNMHPYSIYQGKDGKWYTTFPDEKKGRRKVKRTSREAIHFAVIEFWKEQEENPTLEELFNEWNMTRLERNKIAKGTFDRYNHVFKRHFQDFGQKKIKNVQPEEIIDFLELEVARLHLTAKAFSSLKTTMIGILKRAKRKKLIDFSITSLIEELDISDKDFKKVIKEDYEEVFDEEETKRFMQYCIDNMDIKNTAILLMFITGIRVGELVALKHSDIKTDYITIRRTETRHEKEGEAGYIFDIKEFPKTKAGIRDVVIPKDYQFILKRLKSFNPFGEYVFTREDGQRINTDAIRKRQARICKKLKIYQKSPHKVRKTVGTILFDEKLDNNLIRNQMGWSSCTVGEKHYHRNRKSIDQKLGIISSISEFQRR